MLRGKLLRGISALLTNARCSVLRQIVREEEGTWTKVCVMYDSAMTSQIAPIDLVRIIQHGDRG